MPPKLTYRNLYSQVVAEINKRATYKGGTQDYNNQLGRTSISPLTSSAVGDASLSDILNAVFLILKDTVPPWIKEGLTVSETDPVSSSIIISAGKGGVAGHLYELSSDVTIQIPFEFNSYVYFVNLYRNNIEIELNEHPEKLTIAKIVVPKPDKSNLVIYDQNQDDWNPYIVNFQEYKLYGDSNGNLEEDSIEILRDNIGKVLADNLIGNIRLNEDLTITNTAGTLELNSNSMKIKDVGGNVLSKFDRRGTFFYDENGIEIAKFSTDEARVGNIKITKNTIGSTNFVSGALGSGFRIYDSGDAEFNNVSVRGIIKSSIFEYDSISSVGGNLLIGDSDILAEDMTALNSSTLEIGGNTSFGVGDILRIKEGVSDEWMEVTSINGNIYTVIRDKAGSYSVDSNPIWKEGTCVVNYGQANEGLIFMTSSESNSPYISFVTHTGSPWSSLITNLRIGNLSGISDSLFGSLSGYGLFGDNVYLRGMLALSGNIGTPPATGLYLGGDKLGYYDNGTSEWKVLIESDGNFLFKGDDDNYLEWDGATLTLRGSLNADDITSGTLSVDRLDVGELSSITADIGTITGGNMTGVDYQTAASGARIVIDVDTSLVAYDDNGDKTLEILLTGADIGDLTIGDIGTGTDYLKWDKSAAELIIRGTLQGADLATGSVGVDQLGSDSVNTDELVDGSVTPAKLNAIDSPADGEVSAYDSGTGNFEWILPTPGASSVGQGELKTSTTEQAHTSDTQTIYTLTGGEYVFEYVTKMSNTNVDDWQCTNLGNASAQFAGWTSYAFKVLMRSGAPNTLTVQTRYITASGRSHWIWFLIVKKQHIEEDGSVRKVGEIIGLQQAIDHVSYGTGFTPSELPHPFGDYNKDIYDVFLVNNDMLPEIKGKINSKERIADIIAKDYHIDFDSKPEFIPRETIEIDEYGDKPGTIIKEIMVPEGIRPYIGKEKVILKKDIIGELPNYIYYKNLIRK